MTAATQPHASRRPGVLRASMLGAAALFVASWGYLALEGGGRADLLDPATWGRAVDFVRALFGVESPLAPNPPPRPFLDAAEWRVMVGLAVETLAMSVCCDLDRPSAGCC